MEPPPRRRGQIGHHRKHAVAGTKLQGRLCQSSLAPGANRDTAAFLKERGGGGEPETPARAGHDGDLVSEA